MEAFGLLQIVGLAILAILVIIFFYYVPCMLWINAVVSGVHVSLIQLFLMRIRKVPPTRIVNCLIEAHKAGLTDVKRDGLEAHFLAGGQVEVGKFMHIFREDLHIVLFHQVKQVGIEPFVVLIEIHIGHMYIAAGMYHSGWDAQNVAGLNASAYLHPVAAVILVIVSVSLTFIAGLIPASSAARKDPVVALRSE